MLLKNQKAQVMILDVLLFSLIVVFIVYIELLCISKIGTNNLQEKEETEILEMLLFTDKLISDCKYFAKTASNYESLCYQNIIEIKNIPEIKDTKICKIELSDKVIYSKENTEIRYIIERGVVHEAQFKVISFFVCK